MKTLRNYLALFLATSFAGAFTLRWLALEFLYHQMEDFWSGIGSTVLATGTLGIVISFFIGRHIVRLERIARKARDGQPVTPEERASALGVYAKVNRITVLTNVIAFFLGQFAVMMLDIKGGVVPYHLSCVVLIMIQSVLVGTIAAMYEIYSFNNMMAAHRKALGLHSIGEFGEKSWSLSISATITLVSTVTLLFIGVNGFSAAYGIVALPGTIGGRDELATYLRFGAEAVLFSLAVCAGLMRVITGELKRRIADTSSRLRDLGEKGDLSSRINLSMNDDFGRLTSDLNGFIAQLGRLVRSLRADTGVVAEAAGSLTRSARDSTAALEAMKQTVRTIAGEETVQGGLIGTASSETRSMAENSRRVEQQVMVQTAAMQQSSASVNEMAANIDSVASLATKASALSDSLKASSGQGTGAIEAAVLAISEIQSASAEVQDIVQVLEDIADRTNLLSMNAAIEAAHAGAAGRGFAIVANEVRTLAASSARSAGEIQSRIKDMVAKIDRGVDSIQAAGASFGDINAGIGQTAALIQTIAGAMEEQRVGAKETMQSTSSVVEAIQAIRDLSQRQLAYASSTEEAIGKIVAAAGKISDALKENEERSAKLDDAIVKVTESIAENNRAVESMEKSIGIFRL